VRNLFKFPKVKWVLYQDDHIRAEYYPCRCGCKNIFLDCLKGQSMWMKLYCLTHEILHRIFDIFPNPFYEFFSRMLDITDGNQPELLFQEGRDVYEDSVILYEW